jgi:SAM-dependent methyltransferase
MIDSKERGRSPLSLVGENTDVAFYARQLGAVRKSVLLLGCAGGRLAWELSAKNISIVAVDPSPAMIATAEDHRGREPRESAHRVRFLSGDLRSLRLPDRFEAVVAPQNALGLMSSLDDLGAVIETARYHLLPDGMFVLDAINPARSDAGRSGHGQGDRMPSNSPSQRGALSPHLRERKRAGLAPGSAIRRLRLRQFYPTEVDSALEEGGFVPTARYGRYDEKPFDPDDPLQIVVASLASH